MARKKIAMMAVTPKIVHIDTLSQAAASGTFIDEMITTIGLHNGAGKLARYPELSVREIQALKPEVIMLSSEPFPFSEKHVKEIQAISPDAKILLVDGEMFSWYGSRLLNAVDYFNSLPLERT